MNASAINAASSLLGGQTSKKAEASSKLDREDFLQLLVTQMTHQDPSEPLKDSEFIGQMAQFSALEGIQKLNATFAEMLTLQELTQGANLIGHNVVYDKVGAGEQHGIVDAVKLEDGKLHLSIGGDSVALADVRGIDKK